MRVWDVLLPPWCRGDPRLFTLLHRHALESDYVTQHLAAWLDLVFGAKQTGKAAIEAVNVFHPAVSGNFSFSGPVSRVLWHRWRGSSSKLRSIHHISSIVKDHVLSYCRQSKRARILIFTYLEHYIF